MRDHRPVEPARELLHAGEQGAAANDDGQALDQRGAGRALHGGDKPDHAIGGHDAVGVEDEELVVGTTPAPDPVGDVARLALGILRAATVEHCAADAGAQP